MASIVDFRVSPDQFALSHAVREGPAFDVAIDRFVAQNTDSAMPFVRITTDDFAAFEAVLTEDPSVEEFSPLADLEEERSYRIRWSEDVEEVLSLLLEEEGAVVTASLNTTNGSWEIRLMCPEHDSLSEIYEFCEKGGLSLSVDAVYELGDHESSRHGLTELQYTTLLKAKELGYYDVPRTVSLSELADELDVSHQALSERLRHAHGNLIGRDLGSTDTVRTGTAPIP